MKNAEILDSKQVIPLILKAVAVLALGDIPDDWGEEYKDLPQQEQDKRIACDLLGRWEARAGVLFGIKAKDMVEPLGFEELTELAVEREEYITKQAEEDIMDATATQDIIDEEIQKQQEWLQEQTDIILAKAKVSQDKV